MALRHILDDTDHRRHIPVSVVVPCYQAERYLERALDSLLAQTLDCIEIVCVNDGSTDGTLDILTTYQRQHPESIIVIDKDNDGIWLARIDGISYAHGDYIGFLDNDDYAVPQFCETLYSTAVLNKADIAVCGYRRIDYTTGKTFKSEMSLPRKAFDRRQNPERIIELNGAPWNKLFSSKLIKSIDLLDPPPVIFEDISLLLLLSRHQGVVAFSPDVLVEYSVRSDSTISSFSENWILPTYELLLRVRDIYREDNLPPRCLEFLDAAAFLHLGISLMFRISCNPTCDLKAKLAENEDFLDENFPTWRTSKIISSDSVRKYGGSFGKILWAKRLYEHHLMMPALACYRSMIGIFGKDIKW